MGLALGDVQVASLRLGDEAVTRAYLGDVLVYVGPTTMTVQGTTFAPQLELVAGSSATVSWEDETGSVVGTGLTPTITWPGAGPHTVRIICATPGDIVTLNLGFHNEQDNGIYSLPASYNYPTQPVTEIANLQNLSGLRRFMAARTNGVSPDGTLYAGPLLTGHLDLIYMPNLEYVECFMAQVESVDLTGCTGLLRLCLEQCDLAELDLNPVRESLLDLRAAFQNGQALTLTPLAGPLTSLYHFCTRRNTITNQPDVETMLPSIRQLWVWNTALNLPELTVRSFEDLHSIVMSSPSPGGVPNQVAHLDVAGQTWAEITPGDEPYIEAEAVGLESVDMTGMGPVERLFLTGNALDETAVDYILTTADSWGTSDGILEVMNNTPPSSTGLAAVTSLRARGWTVAHDSAQTLLWSDTFDTDTGANWLTGSGDAASTRVIGGGTLVWSGTNAYRRLYNNATGTLPANLEVRLGFTLATTGGGGPGPWWGVMGRFNGSSGVRALFRSSSTLVRIGNALNATDPTAGDTDVSATLPADWDTAGQHEIALRMFGAVMTLYYDGTVIAARTSAGLPNAANLGVGLVGEPRGRSWDYVEVWSVT